MIALHALPAPSGSARAPDPYAGLTAYTMNTHKHGETVWSQRLAAPIYFAVSEPSLDLLFVASLARIENEGVVDVSQGIDRLLQALTLDLQLRTLFHFSV